MPAERDRLVRAVIASVPKSKRPPGPPKFPKYVPQRPGQIGPGAKITEDDPRWNPKTMGNERGRVRKPGAFDPRHRTGRLV
jgi:hypothetical protein